MPLPTTLDNLLLHTGPAEGQRRYVLLPDLFPAPFGQYMQITETVFQEDYKKILVMTYSMCYSGFAAMHPEVFCKAFLHPLP